MSKIKLDELKILDYNPRLIGKEELERLKQSIKEYSGKIPDNEDGYRLVTTITVNKQGNRIVGGHQRVRALQELGQDWIAEDDVTWVDVEPDSAVERSLNVALNSDRVGGDWDHKKLVDVLETIATEDNDLLERLDISDIDFAELDNISAEVEIPDVEEAPVQKITKKQEPESDSEPEPDEDDEDDDIEMDDFDPSSEPSSEKPVEESKDNVPSEPPDADEPPSEMPMKFPISYAVTADQRAMILKATEKAKEQIGCESYSDALYEVCKVYLGE